VQAPPGGEGPDLVRGLVRSSCLGGIDLPEIQSLDQSVLRAVEAPDHHLPGHLANEEWFYLKTDRPSNWLKVVVAYVEGRGQIVTAFARRSMP
jgi:hypothetical protein